jgi:DNA modification methylase
MIKVREFLEKYAYTDEEKTLEIIPQDNKKAITDYIYIDGVKVKRYIKEFWTSKQRQASSIHEISYRACFKSQQPRFFIHLLSKVGDTVYYSFAGRGTTNIEAGLMGSNTIFNNINMEKM